MHSLLLGRNPAMPPALLHSCLQHHSYYNTASWAPVDRDSTTRITVDQALAHPWFRRMLGFTPKPSTLRLDATCRNN